MELFNISRLNTDFGIFRISGQWCAENPKLSNISVQSIEIMATDGWVLLNNARDANSQIISQLLPLLLSHLLLKK